MNPFDFSAKDFLMPTDFFPLDFLPLSAGSGVGILSNFLIKLLLLAYVTSSLDFDFDFWEIIKKKKERKIKVVNNLRKIKTRKTDAQNESIGKSNKRDLFTLVSIGCKQIPRCIIKNKLLVLTLALQEGDKSF